VGPGIERLDPDNASDVNGVAALHEAELGDSPLVLLGPKFLREFFYRTLVRDGLVGVLVHRIDGQVVGFLSYTLWPDTFIARGVRRHLIGLAWVMVKGMVRRPATLRDALVALRIMRDRSRDPMAPGTAEAISMVVLAGYQKHVPHGGTSRLPVRLFEELASCLRREGAEHVLFLIKPENRASNIFFNVVGCDFEKVVRHGQTVHAYTYHLKTPSAARATTVQ
jgi:hypothetical protein